MVIIKRRPQSSEEHRDFNSGRTCINVCFIKNYELPLVSILLLEEHAVIRSYHKVLQHSIVGDHDMRRIVLHLLTAYKLIDIRHSIIIKLFVFNKCIAVLMSCLAGVASVGYLRIILEQTAQSFHLVVRQSIHRINDHGSDTGIKCAGFMFTDYLCQNRNQEALRFS